MRLTYAINGTPHTVTPQGPDGAYLIVVRSPPETPGNIDNSISGSLNPGPPITSVSYRNGLRCNYATLGVLSPRCRVPPGYAPARTPHYTTAQLATPIHASVRRATQGWHLVLSFIARAPVTNALSSYTATLPVRGGGLYGFPITQRTWPPAPTSRSCPSSPCPSQPASTTEPSASPPPQPPAKPPTPFKATTPSSGTSPSTSPRQQRVASAIPAARRCRLSRKATVRRYLPLLPSPIVLAPGPEPLSKA